MSSRAAKREIMRRLRLGDLRKLLRARCGHTLPDDDAGREYLWELLLPVSLAPEEHERKMANTVEIWAPWLGKDEAEQLIDQINRMPARERRRLALSARGSGSPTRNASACARGPSPRST
jgi:hypothetical protein